MVTKTPTDFINLISNFDPGNSDQKKQLENIIYQFPYFQLAHALYLKTLKIQDQFNFNLILKKTAILSSRRKLIFNWIESNENNLFKILEESTKSKIRNYKVLDNQSEVIFETDKSKEEEPKMFFVDWVLSYTDNEKGSEKRPLESKIEIIDSFLEKNPKINTQIEKGDEDTILNLASDNLFNQSELMTETLAKIYVKQKKIKKAIYAYKILSLKYPEKSSLFANRIKKLQNKKNNKT